MRVITEILLLVSAATAAVATTAATPVSSATPTTTAGIFNELFTDLGRLNPRLRQYSDTLFAVAKNDSINNFNNVDFAAVRAGEYYNAAVGDLYDNNVTFTTRQARILIGFLNNHLKPTIQRNVKAYIAAYPAYQRNGLAADGGVGAYNDATYINQINSFISVKVPKAQQTAASKVSSSISSLYVTATQLYGFTGFPDVPFKRAAPTAA